MINIKKQEEAHVEVIFQSLSKTLFEAQGLFSYHWVGTFLSMNCNYYVIVTATLVQWGLETNVFNGTKDYNHRYNY